MPLVQKIDEKKFIQKPAYSYIGSGLKTKCCRTHPLFLKQDGEGFADFLSKIASLISENKDTIGSVANSVGSVANSVGGIASAAKSISDTSKELAIQKKKSKKKDTELTPEQIASLEKISVGQGFVRSA